MYGKMRPIDVISVCTTDGCIRPLRIRVEDENAKSIRVDIEEVVKMEEVSYVGAESQIFLCRATMWGTPWLFELKYSLRKHSWYLLGRHH